MAQVKVKLLRPLNGQEIGAKVEYDRADAERLAALGAVEIIEAKAKAAPANKGAPSNKAARKPANKGA